MLYSDAVRRILLVTRSTKTSGVTILKAKLVAWAKSAWATFTKIAIPGLWKLLSALAVFVVGRMAARVIARKVGEIVRRAEMDNTRADLVERLTAIALMAVVIITTLGVLGLNIDALAAMLGGVALAIGLSLREQFSSLANGLILAFKKPFRIGDLVDVGSSRGWVEGIGLFDTTLRTMNNEAVFIPNSEVCSSTIVNYSNRPTRRIDLTVRVNYKADLLAVRTVIERVLAEDERILEDPKPQIIVSELASNSVDLAVRPWVKIADFMAVLFGLNEKIKLAFDEANIEVPLQQMEVYLSPPASA